MGIQCAPQPEAAISAQIGVLVCAVIAPVAAAAFHMPEADVHPSLPSVKLALRVMDQQSVFGEPPFPTGGPTSVLGIVSNPNHGPGAADLQYPLQRPSNGFQLPRVVGALGGAVVQR